MDTFDRASIDPWFLSGERVVRLWGRDFDMPVDRYAEWLLELARNYGVEVQIKKLSDPPGVVMRAYMGKVPKDKLVDPLIVVNKQTCPWLFCTFKGCEDRIGEGMPPGSVCKAHVGKH